MLQNKLRRRMLFFALAWCVPFLSIAQKLILALKALVAKGLQKSHSVNAFELDAKLAKVIIENLAKSVFLPKVTLSGSYTRLNDDITFDSDTQNLLIGTPKITY